MPTVTSIKSQKNKKRVNIYLDGKFGFGLDLETFVKHKLKVEQDLSDQEIEKIIKEGEFQNVYDKILIFASLRPRSHKEYNDWLRKHKVHESLHTELFNRLKRLELLDDKKFAAWWIGQRLRFKSKSRRELVQELRFKGISNDTIEDVLSEIQPDDHAMAKKLIEKKKYMWNKLDDFSARKKMSEYLSRKGFGWDVIRKVIQDNSFESH